MRTIFGCVTFSFAMFICGCQTERTRIERTKEPIHGIEYVTIAVVGPSDRETQDIIRTSLQQIDISCVMYGTIAYGVEVPLAQYQEARKRLKLEPKLKGKWIRFY